MWFAVRVTEPVAPLVVKALDGILSVSASRAHPCPCSCSSAAGGVLAKGWGVDPTRGAPDSSSARSGANYTLFFTPDFHPR